MRASYDTGKPVEWKRVHKLPEYAYFNHAVHVNKGVSCVSCHGQVNEMKVVSHDQVLSMGWCLKAGGRNSNREIGADRDQPEFGRAKHDNRRRKRRRILAAFKREPSAE